MNCIGGEVVQENLNSKLQKEDIQKFEVGKAFFWSGMLNDAMKPVKWFKPTRNGQKVKFDSIKDKLQMETAKGELRGYLNYLNEKYGTDYSLIKEKTKGEQN
ncbi:MAG TPA: hypothetical protein VMW10_05075 [Alphaproteobacteria bacterium]|nr:hypothetical protein [Alphaproteobacteria bacterium]